MPEAGDVVELLRTQLEKSGVRLDELGRLDHEGKDVRVVCLGGSVSESVETLSGAPRDQVVMARLNRDVVEELDAWVETGALRSRSEAAALFIQEGLALRARELDELRGALEEVRKAKERLKETAERVLGSGGESET